MDANKRKAIVEQVVARFAADRVKDHEVLLLDDGKIVVDRRADVPWATPQVVGEWH